MTTAIASRYTAEYSTIAPTLPGQNLAWLTALRQQALTKFSAQGFPSLREEEWRYTNVSAIEKKLFSPSLIGQAQDIVPTDLLASYQLPDAWSVVLIDGHFCAELSVLEGLPATVTVMSIADALVQQPEIVERYINQAVNNDEHSLVAFNTAWFTDGLFVHVPAKLILEKPVQVLHVSTQGDLLASTRTVIVAEDMADIKVIETFVGLDIAYLSAAVTEVFVGLNADVTLYKMQCESDKAYHFGGIYVKQA
ncbi:MAG: SufD family Fe-S cluster assembly protein, partial [Methylococcaceae bacterium]